MAASVVQASTDLAIAPVNILLVDDQPARLMTYRTILADLNENLIEATSGKDALKLLMTHEFAVILLDVNMPIMDGYETASLIHQHPRFEKTPIIFITAINVSELDRMRGYKLGAFDYVMVPIIPEILRSKVIVLTELFRKRRELELANRNLAVANESLHIEKNRQFEELNTSLRDANAELEQRNAELQAEIAERVRVEAHLLDQDKRKDEFLAVLAHELRNPLAAVANAAHSFAVSSPTSQQLQEIMTRQLSLLVRLIDDLLDVARIRRGKLILKQAPTSLHEVLDAAIETVAPQLTAGQYVLEDDRADDIPINGDRDRLAQVFSNLLNNAMKYSSPGSKIGIRSAVVDGMVQVAIVDSGIGLTEEEQAWIFELFAQVDTSLERARGGLGIGLTLARNIVEMHGGQVRVHSHGLGHGSRFTVLLPASITRQATVQPPELVVPSTPPRRRVLIVDDNPDSADSLKILLDFLGHTTMCIYDPQAALAALNSFAPDLVFLDIGMPVLSGYDVARLMRAHPMSDKLALVALTGWGQPEDRRRTSEAGFDYHLVKPAGPGSIEQICNTLRR